MKNGTRNTTHSSKMLSRNPDLPEVMLPILPSKSSAPNPFDYYDIERQFLLIDEHHAGLLSVAATHALREGRYHDAFMYADRRCRISPIPGAAEYLARAIALSHLEQHKLAHEDLNTALEIDPNYPLSNLLAMRMQHRGDPVKHASAIVQYETRACILKEALEILKNKDYSAVGIFRTTLDGVKGWIAWNGSKNLKLKIFSDIGIHHTLLTSNITHRLSPIFGNATEINFVWPHLSTYLHFEIPEHLHLFFGTPALQPAFALSDSKSKRRSYLFKKPTSHDIAVIIPVYKDYDATCRCLTSLLNNIDSQNIKRLVIVDDASPEIRLRKLVQSLSVRPNTTVITHTTNLGFARSVNDAIEQLQDEDIILLNSDTVLPPGFISRLAKAAHSAADIGTVTPLSNNGEYTSFPIPFRENPLPHSDEIVAIDRIAAMANHDRIVDMPNGTGFCMYVKRTCLEKIGSLSTSFGKGYFEDVEFCLRAGEAGYRNVCATNVYVGHAGSRSFGTAKRALVTRNLVALETYFSGYTAASAAFVTEDPLLPDRMSIEVAAVKHLEPAYLLIAGVSTNTPSIDHRIKRLTKAYKHVLIATTRFVAGNIHVQIRNINGALPQNINYIWPASSTFDLIVRDLNNLNLSQIEIFDLLQTPATLAEAIINLKIPFSITNQTHSIHSHSNSSEKIFNSISKNEKKLNGSDFFENTVFGSTIPSQHEKNIAKIWSLALSRAEIFVVPQTPAEKPFTQHSNTEIKNIQQPYPKQHQENTRKKKTSSIANVRLALFGRDDFQSFTFLSDLTTNTSPPPMFDTVVLGSTFDDLHLMAGGRVFCSGHFTPSEAKTLIQLYRTTHILFLNDTSTLDIEQNLFFDFTQLPTIHIDTRSGTISRTIKNNYESHYAGSISAIVATINQWISPKAGTHHG